MQSDWGETDVAATRNSCRERTKREAYEETEPSSQDCACTALKLLVVAVFIVGTLTSGSAVSPSVLLVWERIR